MTTVYEKPEEPLSPAHLDWCRRLFASLNEGGTWSIPRSYLFFRKRDKTLTLTKKLPYDPAHDRDRTREEYEEQQRSDIEGTKRHFEAIGITFIDGTHDNKS